MPASSLPDIIAQDITGKPVHLADHAGQVLLIVNTASACGFTPQFAGLETLWATYRDRGLVVLGFPSNEFGGQDPGSNNEIASFCQLNYGVSFPMMAKVKVNGAEAHPLFAWLKDEAPGLLGSKGIKWNFTSSWSAATVGCSSAMRHRMRRPSWRPTSKRRWGIEHPAPRRRGATRQAGARPAWERPGAGPRRLTRAE